MQKPTNWLVLLTIGALVLAGCSDSPAPPDDDMPDQGLEATEDTGIIRGVVVDSAIRPMAGATVRVPLGDGQEKSTTTGEDGFFGFDGLAPGTYVVRVSKLGFFDAQQSTDVVAAVSTPRALRILLESDPENMPYAAQYVFEGFIECGLTSPAVGFSLCGFAEDVAGEGTLNEASQVHHELDRAPTWIQSEMVWDSTQATGNELELMYSWPNAECEPFYCDHDVSGPSMLVLTANATVGRTLWENQTDLYIRVFTNDLDETKAPACVPVPDVPGVINGGEVCPSGAGVTIEQSFRIVTHVFYGYAPPEGWTFAETNQIPVAG